MEDKKVCVVCPVCGAVDEYEFDEIYIVPADTTHIIEYCTGSCSNCNTKLQWEQVYELIPIVNVRAV